MSVRDFAEKSLMVMELVAGSLAIPGSPAAPIALLVGKATDMLQSVFTTEDELTDLLVWWSNHNKTNKPLTQEVLDAKFGRAIEQSNRVQSFRAKYGLPPQPPKSLEQEVSAKVLPPPATAPASGSSPLG